MTRTKRNLTLAAAIVSGMAAMGSMATIASAGNGSEEGSPERLYTACINPPPDCETGRESDTCRLETGCKSEVVN